MCFQNNRLVRLKCSKITLMAVPRSVFPWSAHGYAEHRLTRLAQFFIGGLKDTCPAFLALETNPTSLLHVFFLSKRQYKLSLQLFSGFLLFLMKFPWRPNILERINLRNWDRHAGIFDVFSTECLAGTWYPLHLIRINQRTLYEASFHLKACLSSLKCLVSRINKYVKPLCLSMSTVHLLTHVLCKPTHFFFHSFITTMSYSLQTSFNCVMKDWADVVMTCAVLFSRE